MASPTSSVAAVHFSTTFSWRSSWRDQAHVVLVLDLGDLALVALEDLLLLGGITTSFFEIVMPAR